MNFDSPNVLHQAEIDYNKARSQAFWSTIWARLRGQETELLNFQEVKHKLRLESERYLGRQEIPLDHIVGSVGRYKDFNRMFLPKKSVNRERWKAVDALTLSATGFPPIEVYKVGDAYFVLDGNHRVSVARAAGMKHIEAYVTEYHTEVPFDKDTVPQDLFIKEGYAFFLRKTGLKALRPASEVILTAPGNYPAIIEHIEVHRYFMGVECDCPVSWEDAVMSWYDNVYLPVVNVIREFNALAEFPNRTEADLYVWIIWHQEELQDHYVGNFVPLERTITELMQKRLAQ